VNEREHAAVPVAPAAGEYFLDAPLDNPAVRKPLIALREILARVNAPFAQPEHAEVCTGSRATSLGYVELVVTHPRVLPHIAVWCKAGDIWLFWTGGYRRTVRWDRTDEQIVEALLTGRNSMRTRRRLGQILLTDAVFWAEDPEQPIANVKTRTPRYPPIRRAIAGLLPWPAAVLHTQLSFQHEAGSVYDSSTFRAPPAPSCVKR